LGVLDDADAWSVEEVGANVEIAGVVAFGE
jgi:hypothetical protein